MNRKIKQILLKKNKSKIVSLTAYSKNIAKILDKHIDIILVGDSFIVGNSNSQENIPSVVFEDLSKLSTKNIAYPGSPYFYEQLLLNNKHLYNNETKFIIFYFEGNDFKKKKQKKKKI